MKLSTLTTAVILFAGFALPPAVADEHCVSHQNLVTQVQAFAAKRGFASPEFRIQRSPDGQALVYWHYGQKSPRFHAVTFRANGCAILTTSGEPRRFIFPKTAYNSGVFFELDILRVSI